MPTRRADSLTYSLLQETGQQAFDKVRYSDRVFPSLPMISFALLGGLR